MSGKRDPKRDQRKPVPNQGPAIHDLVAGDLEERKQFGIGKYGTPLQAHNGRDAALDAYEEVLDLAVYLKQLRIEKAELEKYLLAMWRSMRAATFPPGTIQWRDGYLVALRDVMRQAGVELPQPADLKGFFSWRDAVEDE